MANRLVEKIIPGVRWFRGYSSEAAISDLIAGVTVGLTVIPQSLAYGALAGLEPQYGLYSAFMGGIIYMLLGECPQVTIGPTALLALMTSKHTGLGGQSGPDFAILLCFLSGLVQLVMASLRLGALVDLISLPVTVGFTSATALIIAASQLKGLLGIRVASKSGFVQTLYAVVKNIGQTRTGDLCMGLAATVLLICLKILKDVKTPENASKTRRFLAGSMWIISTSRNAIVVIVASVAAYISQVNGYQPFLLTANVTGGLPEFAFPPFHTQIESANGTLVDVNFGGMVYELGSSILLVPIIAVLSNVAISKAFGGGAINPTRELTALSMTNVCGSFVYSIPITGSFSRSAVNHASGVKTPIGGLYTSILVLLALGLLTPFFSFIPKAALSAVIISAVIFMIEYEVLKPLWRCNRRELLPGIVTFLFCLGISVEVGLVLGVFVDLAFLIYRAARPGITVEKLSTASGIDYVIIYPQHSLLCFPAIEWVRTSVANAVKLYGPLPVILDCRYLNEFDFTASRGLEALHKELASNRVTLVLMGVHSAAKVVLRGACSITIPEVANEAELDNLLHEIIQRERMSELREIVDPLLVAMNDAIGMEKK